MLAKPDFRWSRRTIVMAFAQYDAATMANGLQLTEYLH
jgi:hypothetical protein